MSNQPDISELAYLYFLDIFICSTTVDKGKNAIKSNLTPINCIIFEFVSFE